MLLLGGRPRQEELGGVVTSDDPPTHWRSFAPAKVNLFLHVLGRRADGYHLLDSLAVFAGAHDVLAAQPADGLSLEIEGVFAPGLTADADNLVFRAAASLATATRTSTGARLVLTKRLPLASGIGGGSADAAATLRLLRELWRLDLSPGALHEVAAGLGADVAVCLACIPRRMGGIGDFLSAAPDLPVFGLALVNPGIAISTPAVFAARRGGFSAAAVLPDGWSDAATMAAALACLNNDLEPPALQQCPAVGDVLAALRRTDGCLLARMSGSGATCFALYATADRACAAAEACRRDGWWCWGGAPWGFASAGPAPY